MPRSVRKARTSRGTERRLNSGATRLTTVCFVVTTLAAILVRWWFPHAWGEGAEWASVFYQGDSRAFLAYAAHLIAGTPFDNGIPFHPPAWPFVLSLFFRVIGFAPLDGRAADPGMVKLFVACIGGLTVGLTTLVAARIAGTGAMLAVALLGTFHFGHVVQGGVPTSEPLYGLMVVLVLLLTDHWVRTETVRPRERSSLASRRLLTKSRGARSARSFLVQKVLRGVRVPSCLRERPFCYVRRAAGPSMLGALGGFTSLVRAEFLVCAIVLAWLHWRSGARTGHARLAVGAYLLGFFVALVPTTVWHWQSVSAFNASRAGRIAGPLPRFAPVTSYGAFNFAMANHADADGGPNRDHPLLVSESPSDDSIPSEAGLDFASPAVYDLYVHGYRIGLRWLVDNPGDGLALWWKKAAMTAGVFAYGYLQDNIPAGVDGTRRRVDQLDPSKRLLWPIHVGLVIAGAWQLRRRRDDWLLLAAPLLALASSSLMFFGYVRLGVAYLPIFWILQGTALGALASRVKVSDTWRPRIPALVLLAAVPLLVAEAAGARRPRFVTLDGPRDSDGAIVQDETLELRRVR